MLFFEVEIAQFLVISGGRIVDDSRLQFADALAARESLERLAQEAGVGNGFDRDVDQGAEPAAAEDDPQPEGVRSPPDEVDNRERLQQDSPPRKREKE